jgi:hypothetical protein
MFMDAWFYTTLQTKSSRRLTRQLLLQGVKYSSTTTLAFLGDQNTLHGRTTAEWEVNAGAQARKDDSWQPDNGYDMMIIRLGLNGRSGVIGGEALGSKKKDTK